MLHEPRAIITYSVMCPRDSEEAIRFADAFFTWERYFKAGLAVSAPVGTWIRSVDSVPFFRSMIDFGFTKARSNDVVVFANTDICLALYGLEALIQRALEYGVATGPRVNFDYDSRRIYREIPDALDGGIDLVAVTRDWWTKHRRGIPDFVIGREGWDSIFAAIAKSTTGNNDCVMGAVYHKPHQPYWMESRFTDSGQVHNRALVKKFQGLWSTVMNEMPFLIK